DEMIVCPMRRRAKVFGEVLRMIGAIPVVRPDDLAEVLDDGRDGDGARGTAARAAAHPVRDRKQVRSRAGQAVEDLRVLEVRLSELDRPLERRGHEVVL